MENEIIVKLNLEFSVRKTGGHPRFEGELKVSGVADDGQDWKTTLRYKGNSRDDVIRTLTRMDHFAPAISGMAIALGMQEETIIPVTIKPKSKAAGPTKSSDHPPEWYEKREAYFAHEKELLMKESYSGIRAYVTNAGLDVPVRNGIDKDALIDSIIASVKAKEDELNEKNQQS